MNKLSYSAFVITPALMLFACDRNSDSHDDASHGHVHDDGHHDHGPDDAHGDHSDMIEIGTNTIGPFTVRAARDSHQVLPGNEVAIDVWITGDSTQIVAVRFWIGDRQATGSLKAKAEIEDHAEPTHWHTHVEAPNPLSEDAQLWVEIETDDMKKHVGSFAVIK